jgi:repressor LexA
MKQPLKKRQQEVLSYLRDCIRNGGTPPSAREMMSHFGFKSPRAVTDHLDTLERKGYINRPNRNARNIRLNDPISGIPILGTAPAGNPTEAVEDHIGTLDIDTLFGRTDDLFAVQAKGESMKDAGILNGDYVVVRKQPHVPSGAIAVAYLDGQATIKRFKKTVAGYRLEPANRTFRPIEVTNEKSNFNIGGLVVGVVRRVHT